MTIGCQQTCSLNWLTSTTPSAPTAAPAPPAAALSSSATRLPSLPVRGLDPGLLTPIDDNMRLNSRGGVVALPLVLSLASDVCLRLLGEA
jgi:hypothetical protein